MAHSTTAVEPAPAHGAHGVAHHHPRLAHHFESMEQQRESGTLGMWAFLAQEIMFFGGMFLAYLVYRHMYPHEFALASHVLDVPLGAFNTAVLICSSLTMALAVYHAQLGNKKGIVRMLLATILLGGIFLGVKTREYTAKFEEHVFPAGDFRWPIVEEEGGHREPLQNGFPTGVTTSKYAGHGSYTDQSGFPLEAQTQSDEAGHVRIFFWLYFVMTGFHALHMIIGMGLMLVLAYQAHKGKFSKEYHSYIELTGLYWHFVDIIWIFLFPLLYLIDRHKH